MRELTARDYAAKKCVPPCMGCTTRSVGCHASCERYKDYRVEYKKTCDDMYQTQKTQNLANDLNYEARLRRKNIKEHNRRFYSK